MPLINEQKLHDSASWFWMFVNYLIQRIRDDKCSLIASGLTMTSVLALVPLMTVTFNVLSAFPSYANVGDDIRNYIFEHFVPNSGAQINVYLSSFVEQASRLKAIGAIGLVVTALLLMRTIDKSFHLIWHNTRKRRPMSIFLVYWAVLSLGPVLLGLSIALTSYFTTLPLISSAVEQIGGGLKTGLPFLLTCFALSLMYWIIPNCPIRARHALVSGVAAAVLFELAKKGFSFYITQFPSHQFIFGALAAVPIFLMWVYLSWMIILLGAEVCHGLNAFKIHKQTPTREPWLLAYQIVEHAWVSFQQGTSFSRKSLETLPWMDNDRLDEVLRCLLKCQWLIIVDDENFFLGRSLHGITLYEFSYTLPWSIPKLSECTDNDLSQTTIEVITQMDKALEVSGQRFLIDTYQQIHSS
ncbi:MAG: virulence factor BrkB family protein [Pseudomonadota bacterium]